ncbi:MAG: DUF6249 domain-containing protein [Planctomycetota bacterium]|nr:DUF6249 domain-containing protein [Planctomycetota bacterium]
MGSAAAGLGAFGFWMFIASVVVAGIWFDARKRESQQETLRRVVESGQTIDKDVLDRLLAAGGSKDLARDLKVAGLIVIFVAPGLAVLGWFLRTVSEEARDALLGVSFLVGFVGIGLYSAAKLVELRYPDNQG